ncbi:MAG TPA: hypothetical protein VNO55_31640 [Polyangia bacterium]|nr:hypothetical protein [Polyangia bacterium]
MNKAQLQREIRKGHREKHAARLKELRALIAAARVARREAVQAIKLDCAEKRIAARSSCQLRALRAKQQGAAEIERRKQEKASEGRFERKMSEVERPRPLRSTTKQRVEESDDEVRRNLDPPMVPVFNAVKRYIKRTPRMDRTEAFLQWAHENPDEVLALMQHDADRYLAELLAEQAHTEKQLRSSAPYFAPPAVVTKPAEVTKQRRRRALPAAPF